MVKNKINLSLNEPYVRQVYAKEGDSGRLYELDIDPTPTSNGTLRIKRPDGVEVTSPASLGETVESGEFSALDATPFTSLKVGIEPIQDLHGQSNPYPAGGGKNLVGLNTSPASAISYNSCSATYHTDDKVTLVSTTSGTYAMMRLNYTLPAGTYTASVGNITSSDSFEPSVSIYRTSDNQLLTSGIKVGTSKTFTLSAETQINMRFFASSSTAVARTVTYENFMLESGSTATAFAPYSNICPIYANVGRNLFSWDLASVKALNTSGTWNDNVYTLNNVSFTVNTDGTIKAKCTTSASADTTLGLPIDTSVLVGNYYFNGADGGSASTYDCYVWDATSNARVKKWDGSTASVNAYLSFEQIQLVSGHTTKFNVRVHSGQTVDTVFKPMICPSTETNTSYVPYNTQTVELVGRNLFDKSTFTQSTLAGMTVAEYGNGFSISGTASYSGRATMFTLSLPIGNYHFKVVGDLEWLKGWTGIGKDINVSVTSATDVYRLATPPLTSGDSYNFTATDIQINFGNSAQPYEEYTHNTILSTLPQLVYGGTLDVAQGKLTVETVEATLTTVSGFLTYSAYIYTPNSVPIIKIVSKIMANYLKTYKGNANTSSMPDYSITNMGGSNSIYAIRLDSSYSSKADYDAYLANNPLQVVMWLATPTVIDLTPQQINTLIGENNLWASCGDVLEVQFAYDGMLSALPSQATEVVGRCIGDVELGGVSTMPFTLVVQKNNQGE